MASLGACYKQLNSSVGQFGAFTLHAATAAVESDTPGDARYRAVDAALTGLDKLRDSLALRVKGELEAAAFGAASRSSARPARRSSARASSPPRGRWPGA